MKKASLPITEELDFHYLLCLLPPLRDIPEYAWLPELFSIVGVDSLVNLCQYAGGETIRIPTIDELSSSIEALQLFYDSDIKGAQIAIPLEYQEQVKKIREVFNRAK